MILSCLCAIAHGPFINDDWELQTRLGVHRSTLYKIIDIWPEIDDSADEVPALYLVPSISWLKPNALFVSRDYEGKKSEPEWGLNLSRRNLYLLDPFAFENVVKDL